MFLALLLVCNSQENICTVLKAPELTKTYSECVKLLDIGAENIMQQGLVVKDLMCVEFSQGV
jgi:hypothetical protein